MDPGVAAAFHPEEGGLPIKATGGPTGPHSGDPVNLATGRESYFTEPDLSIYNASGPNVVWQRAYLSDQALAEVAGYKSPGFTRGWVHNYDLRVEGTSGSWDALKLIYPNGATETLTPQLSGGVPTGSFVTDPGTPYIVSGVAGTPTGTWQSVTVTWRDQTKWKFTLLSATTYVLNQITNRVGLGLNFTWNAARALTQVTDLSTSTALLILAYDSKGRITTATDAYSRQIVYTFDSGSSTTPAILQTVSQMVNSGTSNPPAHFTYTYTSDRGQQLNTVTVPSPTGSGNSTATINYDSIGKVTSTVDANGNQRVYSYNSGTTQVQVKDSANNVALSWTQKFDTNNLDIGITDAANRSSIIAYADAANPTKPTTVTDRNGHSTVYTYDSFGNVLTVTTPRNLTTTYTWSYANFALGRLTSIHEGSKPATIITYYEPSGLVHTITKPEPNNGAGTTTTTYTYDSLGNILTITTPMGQLMRLLNQVGSTTISDFSSIGYDGVGNRTSVTASIPGSTSLSGITGYSYDNQNQLTQETSTRNSGFTDNFGYDSAGNPAAFKGVTKAYNANNQQIGTGYTHDNNGNPTTYGGVTLVFDPENRMTSYGSILTAGYRGDGLRGWKQNATARTYFLYDGTLPVVEIDNSGSVTATDSFGALGLVSRHAAGSSVFYTFDSEGTVTQRSNSAGSVLSNYIFDSHGAVGSGSLSEPFGYEGQFGYYTDEETGLQLLAHRYYDPNAGRFLTRDPMSYAGGINLYSYVTNDPIGLTDPTGLCAQQDPCNDPSNWNRRLSDYRKIGEWAGFKLDDGGNITHIDTTYPETVQQRLRDHGFNWFIDIHPEHFGYNDYEGTVDGRWYHVSVRHGDAGGGGILGTGPAFWGYANQNNITIHCEELYLRPSGGHRFHWFFKNVRVMI